MVSGRSLDGVEVVLLQLVQVVQDRPVELWIVDAVPVLLVEISRCDLPIVFDYLVDCPLMWSKHLDVLLSQFLPSFGNRTLDDV